MIFGPNLAIYDAALASPTPLHGSWVPHGHGLPPRPPLWFVVPVVPMLQCCCIDVASLLHCCCIAAAPPPPPCGAVVCGCCHCCLESCARCSKVCTFHYVFVFMLFRIFPNFDSIDLPWYSIDLFDFFE